MYRPEIHPAEAPLIELVPPTVEPSRFGRWLTVAAVAGTLLTSACGVEGAQTPPTPTDTRPVATALGQYSQYPEQTFIGTEDFTYPLQQAVETHQLPDYASYGLRTDGSFPIQESAPLFSVTLGKDGKLHVDDETKGTLDTSSSSSQALFGAIESDSTLLTGVMKAGKLHQLRVRIFKAKEPGTNPILIPHSYAEFLPKDPTDGGKNNIYEYLPANDTLDQLSVSTLLQHETIHAALQQGLEIGKLSASDIALVSKACTTLRDTALQEASSYTYDIVDKLGYLRNHVDSQYRHGVDVVIEALQNNTYNKLPLYPGASEVPQCKLQHPIAALNAVVRSEGIDNRRLLDQLMQEGEVGDTVAQVADDWQQVLIQDTIYEHLREADFVPHSQDNELFGHPFDNSDETTTSFTDIAFKFPAEVNTHLRSMSPEAQNAVDTLVGFVANRLQKVYAHDSTVLKWVNEHYAAYLAARKAN